MSESADAEPCNGATSRMLERFFVRFVLAIGAFILAALCIGGGIAQRTIFLGPDTQDVSFSTSGDAAYTLVEGPVLASQPGAQKLTVKGEGPVFAAMGRTADMQAWLMDAEYNTVSLNADGEITEGLVKAPAPTPEPEAEAPAEGEEAAAEEGAAEEAAAEETAAEEAPTPGRNPAGSDLWLKEYTAEGVLATSLRVPDNMSILLAVDGTAPAPSEIKVSWPLDNATPWAGPLIVLGSVFLLAGGYLYFLAIRHVRRSRGPRRKGLPPLADTEAIEVAETDKGVVSTSPARRFSFGRRSLIAVPAIAVSAMLFTACSSESWPSLSGTTPSPSASANVIVPDGQQMPAVTEAQAAEILTRVSATVAEADAAASTDLLATRMTGVALAERTTNYAVRAKVADFAAPAAIPTTPLEIILPQAYDSWPRTVMTVVVDRDDATVPPSIMLLTQDDPWTNYKLAYVAKLEASTRLPDVAPASIGATMVPPDSTFLMLPPDQVAKAYADILQNGKDSEFAGLFDADSDTFRTVVANDREKRLAKFNETGAETASLTFAQQPGTAAPMSLATLENGAIVAVSLFESDTVKPNNDDAVIKLDESPVYEALAGTKQSAKGFTTTFSDQLFFYVPTQGSTEKIRLLGYSSSLLSVGVIE